MEQEVGSRPPSYRPVSISPPTLRRVAPDLAERITSVPRLGDIWIPKSAISPNHFVRLYIPGVEDLYQERGRLLRVEHSGSRSCLISWRLWRNQEGAWRFQQESMRSKSSRRFHRILSPLSRSMKDHSLNSTDDLDTVSSTLLKSGLSHTR
jgi:hypothetical protein